MIETLPTLQEQRDKVVADTQEWLGRTATMMNTLLLPHFPAARNMETTNMGGDRRGSIRQRCFTTPFIVLPAQEVHSFGGNRDKEVMMRRVATKLCFKYDYPASETLGVLEGIHAAAMPIPDEVTFIDPHPVAIPADKSEASLYEWNSTAISGHRLELLRWATSDAPGGHIPNNTLFNDEDEVTKFSIFRDYPSEALARKPRAIDFHRDKLEKFIDGIAAVVTALQNAELNPRP